MKKPRLTDEQVIAIHRSPASPSFLAKQYGVSRQTVYAIKNGTMRKDLKLGKTQKYRELEFERFTGLQHAEKSVTARQVLDASGDEVWKRIKAEKKTNA